MECTFSEKMAIVKIITDLMKADGVLHRREMQFLEQVKSIFDFDIPTVEDSEDLPIDSAYATLKKMNVLKKNAMVKILQKVAEIDGFVHEKEMALIQETFKNIEIGKNGDVDPFAT